ncbi:autophagy-related protein 22-like protein [Globomyces pollinis-pini]|nr:autophagy-related protein 22-like protein [Globomyces pollinis-pini]
MESQSTQHSIPESTETLNEGMDSSLVTPSELFGWYSYGIAAEGYSVLAVSVFFPIILQSLTAQQAVERNNHSIPCNTTGAYMCDILIFGIPVDTSALVLYATTVSVFLQFILFVTLGSLADYGSLRKRYLLICGILSGILGMCMLLIFNESLYWLAFLVYISSNTLFGASCCFYYAYVPILTRFSKEVFDSEHNPSILEEEKQLISDRVCNEISSVAIYYSSLVATLQLLLGSIFVVLFGSGKKWGLPDTYPMCICIAAISVWQIAIILIYTKKYLKPRPGPPLPEGQNYILFSIKILAKTITEAKKLPELFKFLIGWFLYADGFTTVCSVSVLFAQSQLGASPLILLISAVIVPFAAAFGTIAWVKFQQRYRLATTTILTIHSLLYSVLPIFGLVGFFTESVGMHHQYELPFLALYHGLLLGATQSSCRVLFSELLPQGCESEFFGLYEISDKGSTWVGPLIVALITQITGNVRWAFLFLLFLFAIPTMVFSSINIAKAKQDAKAYNAEHKLLVST